MNLTGTRGELVLKRWWTFGFHTTLGISRLAMKLFLKKRCAPCSALQSDHLLIRRSCKPWIPDFRHSVVSHYPWHSGLEYKRSNPWSKLDGLWFGGMKVWIGLSTLIHGNLWCHVQTALPSCERKQIWTFGGSCQEMICVVKCDEVVLLLNFHFLSRIIAAYVVCYVLSCSEW
jgi:hypothetical protein